MQNILTLAQTLTVVNVIHAHARKCDGTITIKVTDPDTGEVQKFKEPCKICVTNTKRLGEIPAPILSECLAEVPPPPAMFCLATLILESTFERGTHNTHRAMRDRTAGMVLLKEYQDMGGKLKTIRG